jgi:hypothetical protein
MTGRDGVLREVEMLKNLNVGQLVMRHKWALAVVTLGAVVASGGAGVKWGSGFF